MKKLDFYITKGLTGKMLYNLKTNHRTHPIFTNEHLV
jgi:hypothetical protein